MTIFGGWLRQLILIIFLAILADLLLPTKAMQRYVRMVMGLAVIAAMLQPMMPLFHGDWANQLADSATSEILGSPPASGTSTFSFQTATLKHQLQAEQSQTEVALLEERLKQAVAQACNCTVTEVVVKTDAQGRVTVVKIVAPNSTATTRKSIIQFLSNQLALRENQVQVANSVEGGSSLGP